MKNFGRSKFWVSQTSSCDTKNREIGVGNGDYYKENDTLLSKSLMIDYHHVILLSILMSFELLSVEYVFVLMKFEEY